MLLPTPFFPVDTVQSFSLVAGRVSLGGIIPPGSATDPSARVVSLLWVLTTGVVGSVVFFCALQTRSGGVGWGTGLLCGVSVRRVGSFHPLVLITRSSSDGFGLVGTVVNGGYSVL